MWFFVLPLITFQPHPFIIPTINIPQPLSMWRGGEAESTNRKTIDGEEKTSQQAT